MAAPWSDEGSDTSRLVALESLMMHMQHELEALNSVILVQQGELARLRMILSRLDERLNRAVDGNDPPFDPALEKPPHY